MELNTFTSSTTRNKKTRVGRGGKRGKTSGRGGKGQTARAGNKRRPEWRDLIKKIPKRRGFGKNRGRTVVPLLPTTVVNLAALEKHVDSGAVVDVTLLMKKNLIRRISGKVPPVKILGGGAFTKKISVAGIPLSSSAREAIEKAGGTIKD